MTYHLNGQDYHTDEDVYWALADIETEDCTPEMFEEIVTIFNVTPAAGLRNSLACFMAETKNEKALPVIMEMLERIKYSNHSATLIYAVDEFDCSDYYELLVDISIAKWDEARFQIIWLIRDTKYRTVKKEVKDVCLKKLDDYLQNPNPDFADDEGSDCRDITFLRELIAGLEEKDWTVFSKN